VFKKVSDLGLPQDVLNRLNSVIIQGISCRETSCGSTRCISKGSVYMHVGMRMTIGVDTNFKSNE
jgi:hypothetical protein